MKIVYIIQHLKRPGEGGSSRGIEMAKRMAARGHDVHLVASSSSVSSASIESLENFTVHWLPVPYHHSMGVKDRIVSFFSFSMRAAPRARALKGDLVFATSTPLTSAIPALVAIALRPTPMVFEVRDLWPSVPIALGYLRSPLSMFLARSLESIAYRASAHIIALSPDMKMGIMSRGVRSERVTVIPNASDNDLFVDSKRLGNEWRRKLPWLGDRPLVLYCGTVGKVNGLAYLVRVASAVYKSDPDVRFVIVGDGNELEQVVHEARRLGVYEKNFFVLPPVSKSDVPGVFGAATVTVSTVADVKELAANSANKVFDSFAAGKPVAINHGGWLAELLESTGAGIVMDGADAESGAAALLDFIASPEKLGNAGLRAQELAHSEFDRQILADRLTDVLEREAHWK